MLKLYLNYSLFVFEVMEDAERAIDMASVAVFEAVEEMKALEKRGEQKIENKEQIRAILNKIGKNVEKWRKNHPSVS